MKARFVRERLWHAGAQLRAMCLDELAHGMPQQRPFPIKALDDCMDGGFVYVQFFSRNSGPLKYQLKHVGLTALQLHVMSRNVPPSVLILYASLFSRPPNFSSIADLLGWRNLFIMEKLALASLLTIYLLCCGVIQRHPPLTFTGCHVSICDLMENRL